MTIKYPKNHQPILNYQGKYLVTKDKTGTYILHCINDNGTCTKLKTSMSPLFPEVYPELQGGDK